MLMKTQELAPLLYHLKRQGLLVLNSGSHLEDIFVIQMRSTRCDQQDLAAERQIDLVSLVVPKPSPSSVYKLLAEVINWQTFDTRELRDRIAFAWTSDHQLYQCWEMGVISRLEWQQPCHNWRVSPKMVTIADWLRGHRYDLNRVMDVTHPSLRK